MKFYTSQDLSVEDVYNSPDWSEIQIHLNNQRIVAVSCLSKEDQSLIVKLNACFYGQTLIGPNAYLEALALGEDSSTWTELILPRPLSTYE